MREKRHGSVLLSCNFMHGLTYQVSHPVMRFRIRASTEDVFSTTSSMFFCKVASLAALPLLLCSTPSWRSNVCLLSVREFATVINEETS